VEILITEGQLKRIIAEQTKPVPVKPKNKSYTTTQDRVLTKDALTGGELKIPKGTKFTAHQNGDKKITKATFTASVDRFENGKNKPSTIYYCNGANSGKFWNGASKSWYYDKTKVLSGFLTKNLCEKSFGDQSYWESKKIDIKNQRTPAQIANFLKTSNTLDDNEPAIELAFSEIRTLERYNLVKKYLGQDPYKFVSQFIDAREKHGPIQSVTTSYSVLSKGKTSDQNKNLLSSEGCPIVLTAARPGGPKQYLGAINFMKFFKGAVGTPGSDPLLYTNGATGTYAKVPDFGWKLNNQTYPYPKYYDQNCLNIGSQSKNAEDMKNLVDRSNQSDINRQDYLQKRDSETLNIQKAPIKPLSIKPLSVKPLSIKPLSLNEEDNKSKDYKTMQDFNQSLSKQKELIPKFCSTPLKREWDAGDGSGKFKQRFISMYNLCKDYGGLWVYGVGGSKYTCGCRDNSNTALTTAIKTDTGTFNVGQEINKQQGSTNWGNVEARSVIIGATALASAFIPVVGPFVAAGIGLGGAADLWTSNKKKEAGIAAFFSLLPIVGKIPGVGTITKGLAEELKAAVISNGALSEKQLETLIKIIKYDEQVSEAMIPAIEKVGHSKIKTDLMSTLVKETEKKIVELSGLPNYGDLKKEIAKSAVGVKEKGNEA
jgi:hypothetical protein